MKKTQEIRKGQGILRKNGLYHFVLLQNGRLVLYFNQNLLWSAKTTKGDRFVLESNGNAVLYDDKQKILFSTETTNNGDRLELLDTGILVLYDSTGKTLWSSNTTLSKFNLDFYIHPI